MVKDRLTRIHAHYSARAPEVSRQARELRQQLISDASKSHLALHRH
jgi:hypothetical protein